MRQKASGEDGVWRESRSRAVLRDPWRCLEECRAELCRAGSVLRARGSPWRAFAREAIAKASPGRGWSILGIRLELLCRSPLPPHGARRGLQVAEGG